MSSVNIRWAQEADCDVILQLIRELAEFEKLADQVVATPQQIRETLFGARPYAEVLLAAIQDEVMGFALFFHNYSTFLAKSGIYLEDLFVKPTQRNQGIGRQLLRRVAQIAVERNCGRVEWSVLDWNTEALRFYRRIGAEPQNEWTVQRLDGDRLKTFAQSVDCGPIHF